MGEFLINEAFNSCLLCSSSRRSRLITLLKKKKKKLIVELIERKSKNIYFSM